MNNLSDNRRSRSRWSRQGKFAGLVLLCLLFGGVWSILWIQQPYTTTPSHNVGAAAVVSSVTPSQTAPAGATPTWSGDVLQATAVAIARTIPTLSPNPRMEPTKDAYERHDKVWDIAIQTAIALYPPPTPIFYPELFTPIAHDPWPTAIIDKRTTSQGVIYDDPFIGPPCSFILDSNHWYGQAVGERTHVCAGADNDRPVKGAIVVEVWHAGDDKPTYIGTYWTPSDQGAVRIQDVVGNQVVLVSTNNTTFIFDLATRQWVSSTPGTPSQATGTPIPTSTAGTGYPPPRLAGTKEAAWTAVAEHDNELSTEVALHPIPTRTPGEPPIYPSATPKMGILQGCAMTTSPERLCYNAWRGVINGESMEVRAGREGSDGDSSQGLIVVENRDTHVSVTFLTPQKVGPVKVVSVDGLRFTLAVVESPWTTATPGTTFVFDLSTLQWLSAPSIPTPTPVPWATGIGGCVLEMTAGSGARTSVNCWYGVINGYNVLVRAGYERHMPVGKSSELDCPTQGLYSVQVKGPTDPYLGYLDWFYPSCYTLHILSASGSVLTFQDETGAAFVVDIAQYIPPAVATPTATPIPSPTMNSKQLYTLHVEQTHAAERTAFALSGIPTWTPGAPPPYTGPTMTPVLGLLRGCANTSSLEPYMISCWAGWYDGHIMGVRSGREGRAGDITQGVVRVYNTDTQELHYYRTPDKVGAIKITAVDGTLFTLTTVDHTPTITYTFDLDTRQWVNP